MVQMFAIKLLAIGGNLRIHQLLSLILRVKSIYKLKLPWLSRSNRVDKKQHKSHLMVSMNAEIIECLLRCFSLGENGNFGKSNC